MMGFKIRYRDPELLKNEILSMVRKYELDEIYFEDDNFTANKSRAHAILDSLIELNLGINFKFANGIRADGLDREILEKMKKAGCYTISLGIESGSSRVLKMMKKNLSLEKVIENVRLAKSMGYLVGANCIIGYPGETYEDIEESLDFFKNLGLDSMALVNLIPFPGTEVRKICEEKNWLTPEASDWNNYIFDVRKPRVLIETEVLSKETVRHTINKAYRKMYLNPKRIYKLLRHSKTKILFDGIRTMSKKVLR